MLIKIDRETGVLLIFKLHVSESQRKLILLNPGRDGRESQSITETRYIGKWLNRNVEAKPLNSSVDKT